jgi:hypothetical protein
MAAPKRTNRGLAASAQAASTRGSRRRSSGVPDTHLRPRHERPADRQHLLLASRKRAGDLCLGEIDPDRRVLKMLGARGSHVAAETSSTERISLLTAV